MTKEGFIRLSGWALMLGSVIYVFGLVVQGLAPALNLQMGSLQPLGWWSIYIGLLLTALGMLGLRARYGDQVGRLGKAALLVGAISGVIAFTGSIELFYQFLDEYWLVIWAGTFLLFTCLLLFGILALRRKPLPRWNGLPVVAGTLPVALVIGGVLTGGDFLSLDAVGAVAALISAIPLLPLGYILQADAPQADTSGEPAIA